MAKTFTESDGSPHHGNLTSLMIRLFGVVALCLLAAGALPAIANAQTKSLKLYYLHTGEKAEITYKRGNQYLASGLKKINWHLRDWRRNEPTKMDPKLLDLVWEAYRQSGSKAYIHVISGYRSPASNNLLRKRGRGVAKNSQHTLGKALDFFLPDVKLSKMREIGLKLGVGGVGYYPKSGSPFVHFDTGSVRHWPRMSRQELVRVFPKGDTMHVPTDGKPLARYQQAVAAYERRKKSGNLVPQGPAASGGNFFQRLAALNNNEDDEEDDSSNASAPAPRTVRTTTPQQPEAPEFAALPRRVPVPLVAPRGQLVDQGQEIVIAAAEPEPTPVPDPEPESSPNDPLLREETVTDAEEPVTETGLALASLSIPVPARRPEFDVPETPQLEEASDGADAPQPDAILVTDNEPARPDSALAMLDDGSAAPTPDTAEASRGTLVAALTPSEIEDLRSRVRTTIGQTTLRAPIPAETVSMQTAIRPAAEVGSEEPASQNATPDGVASIESASSSDAGETSFNTLPVPQQNPASAESGTVETAGTETGVADTPAVKPNALEIEAQPKRFAGIEIASLPVPQMNPLGNTAEETAKPDPITTAQEDSSRDTAAIVVASTGTPTPTPRPAREALPQRTISLDRYSAPQDNTAVIGQFALATTITIRDLADVRAPAYGRNVIRQVPDTILVQGFARQPFGPGENAFSGRAVNAMNFPKRRIN